MKFTEQIKKVREEKLKPIYFFYGEDDFLNDQLVEALLPRVVDRPTRDFNYSVFYGGENSVSEFLQIVGEFPMMAERRVVLVYDFHKFSLSDQDKDALTKYILSPLPSTCLILTAEKTDQRQNIYKVLTENSVVFDTNIKEEQVVEWLEDHLAERKLHFSEPAIQTMIALVGNNLRELANSVEKVITFRPNRSPIEATDVKEVVGLTKTYQIFDYAKMVGMRDYPQALKMTKALLEQGEYPVRMINVLSQHFQKLAKTKELVADNIPYKDPVWFQHFKTGYFKYLDEYKFQSQKYRTDEIHENLLLLLEADYQLKSSGLKPEVILETLIYRLLRTRKSNFETVPE